MYEYLPGKNVCVRIRKRIRIHILVSRDQVGWFTEFTTKNLLQVYLYRFTWMNLFCKIVMPNKTHSGLLMNSLKYFFVVVSNEPRYSSFQHFGVPVLDNNAEFCFVYSVNTFSFILCFWPRPEILSQCECVPRFTLICVSGKSTQYYATY